MRRMLLHQGIGHGAGGVFSGGRFGRFAVPRWHPVRGLCGDVSGHCPLCKSGSVSGTDVRLPHPYRFDHEERHYAEKNLVILDVGEDVTHFIAETVPVLKAEAEYLQLVTYLKTLKGILDGGFASYPEARADLPLCAGTPGACPAALAKKGRPDQGGNTSDQQAAVLCRLWAGRMEK